MEGYDETTHLVTEITEFWTDYNGDGQVKTLFYNGDHRMRLDDGFTCCVRCGTPTPDVFGTSWLGQEQ